MNDLIERLRVELNKSDQRVAAASARADAAEAKVAALTADLAEARKVLEVAKADIEEWIRCFPGDEYDSGFAGGKVIAQIDAALGEGQDLR